MTPANTLGAAQAVRPDPFPMKKLLHGTCYYPELWPESDINRDLVEMQRVGLNMVRIGEFTWSKMEPDEGKVSLDFFVRVLDKVPCRRGFQSACHHPLAALAGAPFRQHRSVERGVGHRDLERALSAFRPGAGAAAHALPAQCLTEHKLGRGAVVVLGAWPDGDAGQVMLAKLVTHYAAQAGVTLRFDVTPGTLVCPRVDEQGQRMWVIVNLDGKGGSVRLPTAVQDALSGEKLPAAPLRIGRYAWSVLRFELSANGRQAEDARGFVAYRYVTMHSETTD